MGVTFFGPFFFFLFFLFLLHLARGCSKKNYFYRVFLNTLLKHLVTSCSNNQLKPKPPPKKCTFFFFFGNPFFDQNYFSKTLILHHPLKIVHWKNSKKTYFYRLKKRWPSYWPWGGQVIDLEMAKMWPKRTQSQQPHFLNTSQHLLSVHSSRDAWQKMLIVGPVSISQIWTVEDVFLQTSMSWRIVLMWTVRFIRILSRGKNRYELCVISPLCSLRKELQVPRERVANSFSPAAL